MAAVDPRAGEVVGPGPAAPGVLARVRRILPRGDLASAETLASRQRVVTWILWAHVVGLLAFGVVRGAPTAHLVGEIGVLVALIVASAQSTILSPTVRATISSIALMVCSALLVHLSGGAIEAHFHFFVMVTVIALYQHWVPFIVAIAFVALHHGVVGVLAPEIVYDHRAAYTAPVLWALIHAGFVLAASAAQVAFWRMAEDEHDRSKAELARQATHDPLTGLANRTLFLDRLREALAGDHGAEDVGVLFVDVDDFKMVNDALGHMAGDELLLEVGQRLSAAARPGDTCARLGGDEFALLLPDLVGVSDAVAVAEAALAGLRRPITVEQEEVGVNASIGVVVTGGGESAAQVMRNADLAMYEAKRAGKGRCALFQDEMLSAAIDRLALREDLHRALGTGELVNEYQPIVDLATGEVVGAEALVRWQHPTRGMLHPGSFIALAEERTDLIVPLGRGVLERACRAAAAWPTDRPFTVSVNLSARQVHEPGLVATVSEVLRATGLPASMLTLEITESVLVEDPERAAATLSALKGLGVSLALDDFGTGFSSLSYLAAFPVDGLKVDKSFIDPLVGPDDGDHGAVVAAIVDMAHRLDLEVTAEGVEHRSQTERLLALGCTRAQGFLLGRPRTAESLQALLSGDVDPSLLERR